MVGVVVSKTMLLKPRAWSRRSVRGHGGAGGETGATVVKVNSKPVGQTEIWCHLTKIAPAIVCDQLKSWGGRLSPDARADVASDAVTTTMASGLAEDERKAALLARQAARHDVTREVWSLMQFAIWHRLFVEGGARVPAAEEDPLAWL